MSLINSNYPTEKIEILVGSDGSSDKTNEILTNISEKYPQVKPYFYGRTGKNGVLNDLCTYAKGELFFFMDADCRIPNDTISKLVNTLSDNEIGAAIASLKSVNATGYETDAGAHGEGLYQNYEQMLRISESLIHSTVISLGGFYCIRADYYRLLPNANVCDDWMNLMFVAMNKKRIVCLADAFTVEIRDKSLKDELKRRIRITAGAIHTIIAGKKLLNPLYGWYAFAIWSHRILRYMAPIFFILILIFSFLLNSNPKIMSIMLISQGIFYLVGLIGLFFNRLQIDFKLTKIVIYFLTMLFGMFLGYFRLFNSNNISIWANNSKKHETKNN